MEEWEILNFARDLSTFNALALKYELPVEQASLRGLEGKLQHGGDFSVSVKDIEFNIFGAIAGTIPTGINMFSVFFSHDCHVDNAKNKEKEDPFFNKNGYSFQLNIVGYKDDEPDAFHSWLHLDRHEQGGDEPKHSHPFYHFQFGGDEMETRSTGQLMLPATPRIAHPPMDLFLGIHFILDNFYNKNSFPKIKEMMLDDDYCHIIRNAQKRLWLPYFKAFTEGFDHVDYTRKNIFPLYIDN